MAGPPLIDVARLDPRIVIDLRYATADNFLGRMLYPNARALLRPAVADRLVAAQDELSRDNLRIIVWDAYRPLSVQRAMWEALPDSRFVADPARGSRHNRGTAVDVALADAEGGPLPMPTAFDDFSPAAHRRATTASPTAIANLRRLERAMSAAGFLGLEEEWWHFDAPDWREYDLLDLPFDAAAAE